MVVANYGTNAPISILLGNGNGTFKTVASYAVGSDIASVAVGDFNGDSKPDLAVGTTNGSSVAILLGNGDGTFSGPSFVAVGGSGAFCYAGLAVGDFNGDGKLDVAATGVNVLIPSPDPFAGFVAIMLGNGDGTFKAATDIPTGGDYPSSIAVADLNHDSKPDLVVANRKQPKRLHHAGQRQWHLLLGTAR